eukprot:9417153-Lingulodinium_polyedra.AAC.1
MRQSLDSVREELRLMQAQVGTYTLPSSPVVVAPVLASADVLQTAPFASPHGRAAGSRARPSL